MSDNMKHPYPKTVEEAATILDNEIPNWYEKIDVCELRMSSCSKCIIGQVFGFSGRSYLSYQNFCNRIYELFTFDRLELDNHALEQHILNNAPFGAKTPKSAWIKEIEKRK